MKILVVSYYDDNFGDMLIRVCFDGLLHTALDNLGISEDTYTLQHMHINEVDQALVRGADMIFFAGGAMFGINYLGTTEAMEEITAIADEEDIPVVLSSIGINHVPKSEEDTERMRRLLGRRCIRGMSVRENAAVFSPFTEGSEVQPIPVCDPAVWARYRYHDEVSRARSAKTGAKTVGINIVRGGLFKANGYTWQLEQEEEYLYSLMTELQQSGIGCRFYTNGSLLDNNTMRHFQVKYELPDEMFIYTDTTREVISAIAGCDAVAAIRMHSAIIAYALDIPSLNLIWNQKLIPYYQNIGYPDRALALEGCTGSMAAEKIREMLAQEDYRADPRYLMSVYTYLTDILSDILERKAEPYSFEQVATKMTGLTPPDEDITDYRTKLTRSRNQYYKLFMADRKHKTEVKRLKAKLKESEEGSVALTRQIHHGEHLLQAKEEELKRALEETDQVRAQLSDTERKIADLRQQLYDSEQRHRRALDEIARLQSELDQLNSTFVVRSYRKLSGAFGGKKE